jgi:hypothetical protein
VRAVGGAQKDDERAVHIVKNCERADEKSNAHNKTNHCVQVRVCIGQARPPVQRWVRCGNSYTHVSVNRVASTIRLPIPPESHKKAQQ